MNLKTFIAKLGRLIGLGPTSELARPSDYGTGHTGTDRGERYVRTPRTSGQSQQRQGDHPEIPSMPSAGRSTIPGADQATRRGD